jgi:ADP-heptose:LPS heptosyltransferase
MVVGTEIVVDTTGRTDLEELCGILKGARVVICHDSGIMHMADALDVPTVALYGPTDYARTAPQGKLSLVLRKDLACAPCMYGLRTAEAEGLKRCGHPAPCMKAITPVDAIAAVRRLLG